MNRPIIQKYNHVRSKKLRDSAKGAPCMINSPVCSHDYSTCVFAHLDSQYHGKGTGCKADDSAGAIACRPCHDWVSLETKADKKIRDRWHENGAMNTIVYWFAEGIVLMANEQCIFGEFSENEDRENIKKFSDLIRAGAIEIV